MARQFGQCVVDQIRVILNVLNIWLITSLGRLLCEFVQKVLLPFLVPSPVSEFVAGNTVCPLSKTGLILQFLNIADDGHPGVLNGVSRRVLITGKLPGISPQTRLPSCDEIFKGLGVTLLTVRKQIYWIGVNRTIVFPIGIGNC